MTATYDEIREALLRAALPHGPFDGWTEATFRAAVADSGTDAALAAAVCPRGSVDLALAAHAAGDRAMLDRIGRAQLDSMRFRDRVAAVVRWRIEAAGDREVVRRAVTLFALPQHAADGARAIWQTCDAIWTALGDSAQDYNWYTKRATLAGVYSATLLYWLGDTSEGSAATWEFLDRRIDNVMQIEKLKASANANPLLKPVLALPNWFLGQIRPPAPGRMQGFPGQSAPRG